MTTYPIQLAKYTVGDTYTPGASLAKQLLWFYIGSPLVKSRLLPFSALKVALLRGFGASIGQQVRIKPGVQVKFPWRLSVGDDCWIGEQVWIDNLASITIAHDVCISQGAYLCTGNHDWSTETFDLKLGAITIGHSAWIGARAVVGPNVRVGEGAILTVNSVANQSLLSWMIYVGNPAQPKKQRVLAWFESTPVQKSCTLGESCHIQS